jgi:hypothetical protein
MTNASKNVITRSRTGTAFRIGIGHAWIVHSARWTPDINAVKQRSKDLGTLRRPHVANFAKTVDDEPDSYEAAITHPTHGKQWEPALQEEYDSIIKSGTWELVPRPTNRDTVSWKWVFKAKKNEEGTIIRFKARLVVRGFTQVYGVDYMDTFAPVAKMASLWILLAIAAFEDLEIHQMDVITAFLAGKLDVEVYME